MLHELKAARRVCLVSNGCPECRMDVATLERQMTESLGFKSDRNYRQADEIVFYGCSVNQQMEDQSRRLIELLKSRKKADAKLTVTGCLAKIRPDLATNDPKFPELAAATTEILKFKEEAWKWSANYQYRPRDEIQKGLMADSWAKETPQDAPEAAPRGNSKPRKANLAARVLGDASRRIWDYIDASNKKAFVMWDEPNIFCIKISTGCCCSCSYCSIRLSRGGLRSKPQELVCHEFERGLQQGFTEFALFGTNLANYGMDLGYGLVDLLDQLVRIPGKYQIALRNVEANYLITHAAQFAELVRGGRINSLHSPIQTGSERILKLMNRQTDIKAYLKALKQIRAAAPQMTLLTQIMVGFPGENDRDFAETVSLVKRAPFDHYEIFSYTDRPGTVAATMTERADPAVVHKRQRSLILRNFFLRPVQRWTRRIGIG